MNTLKSDRLHIGIFGRTNVGKSTVLNRIANQEVSIVSEINGTTTDVVEKSMELLPIGPVRFLDTAGIDDKTTLGSERVAKTLNIINRVDIALIICDYNGISNYEKKLIEKFKKLSIPFIIVANKMDVKDLSAQAEEDILSISDNLIKLSAKSDNDIVFKLKSEIIKLLPEDYINSPKIITDIIVPKSTAILVVPIDKQAPKGRLILPQVQTIRDLLDGNCLVYVVKDSELEDALNNLKTPPDVVITDSQAFKKVNDILPKNILLTSFSILFARLKGDLNTFINGAKAINNLNDGDKVLILESCSHHSIEDDIGKVKIPKLILAKTGKNLIFEHFSGHDFPDISSYKLIIHCGACMTNRREVLSRILRASEMGIPITNYGIAISYCLGILDRATEVFDK